MTANFYVDTSAYKISRLPAELVSYLGGRGRARVLFGSNFPMIMPHACLEGIAGACKERHRAESAPEGRAGRRSSRCDQKGAGEGEEVVPRPAPRPGPLVRECVEQYEHERNHQGIDNQLLTPIVEPASHNAPIECRERLGGLLKHYVRAA